MLSLRQITKNYEVGGQSVPALRGIDLAFRESEFVSILGPSGCGKTTLLNLIGGLDQYTSGDLMINGRSTRQFTDRDWDAYRNHSIGFVFQSYNLIPHQSVLANVELALTLSGVSKAERRRRAADALRRVGLGDQLHKKPNQMSGGQMQRVAIARALVNDPDILLADEPTGALDSETSVQVMELLREIAHDRLIIMVTHNPELAQRYSTRLIRLLDGRVVDDSAPYAPAEAELQPKKSQPKPKKAKTGMSFFTALSLSANNLLTKKARTFLTSFAGSIGIIGIALILSVSAGVNAYIESVQRDTLSSYPIEIEAETVDYTALIQSMMEATSDASDAHERDAVYSSNVMAQLMNSMTGSSMQRNDLKRFKQAMESGEWGDLTANASAIRYKYDLELPIYVKDSDGSTVRADVADVMAMMYGDSASMMQQYSGGSMSMWEELLPGADGESVNSLLTGQYDVVYGRWPESYDEIVLVLNERNEVSDLGLYALGLKTKAEMQAQVDAIRRGEPMDDAQRAAWYDLCADQLFADGTYDARLRSLGVVDPAQPAAVQLYADSFEAKDAIADAIDAYNRAQSDESAQLRYTDYVALLMSSITTILNAISYVLIAFVAISLVVSSIMIGIITYISVLERTKEIGILRAIGASKRDIARVFNAEALIIGFAAGAIGIGITVLFNGGINLILHRLTGIATLNAVLPALGAGILVALSMFLTFIAGLVPSRIAARKDPVIALRSE